MRPRGENIEYDKLNKRFKAVTAELAAKELRVHDLEIALEEICGESTEPAIVKLAERALQLI